MRPVRIGLFAFAFWMIGFGIFIFVGSLSYPDPMPETLMPLAALMGVVLGFSFCSRCGRFRCPRVAAAPTAAMTTSG
jgi:hypothetical protein